MHDNNLFYDNIYSLHAKRRISTIDSRMFLYKIIWNLYQLWIYLYLLILIQLFLIDDQRVYLWIENVKCEPLILMPNSSPWICNQRRSCQ